MQYNYMELIQLLTLILAVFMIAELTANTTLNYKMMSIALIWQDNFFGVKSLLGSAWTDFNVNSYMYRSIIFYLLDCHCARLRQHNYFGGSFTCLVVCICLCSHSTTKAEVHYTPLFSPEATIPAKMQKWRQKPCTPTKPAIVQVATRSKPRN